MLLMRIIRKYYASVLAVCLIIASITGVMLYNRRLSSSSNQIDGEIRHLLNSYYYEKDLRSIAAKALSDAKIDAMTEMNSLHASAMREVNEAYIPWYTNYLSAKLRNSQYQLDRLNRLILGGASEEMLYKYRLLGEFDKLVLQKVDYEYKKTLIKNNMIRKFRSEFIRSANALPRKPIAGGADSNILNESSHNTNLSHSILLTIPKGALTNSRREVDSEYYSFDGLFSAARAVKGVLSINTVVNSIYSMTPSSHIDHLMRFSKFIPLMARSSAIRPFTPAAIALISAKMMIEDVIDHTIEAQADRPAIQKNLNEFFANSETATILSGESEIRNSFPFRSEEWPSSLSKNHRDRPI